MNFIRKVIYGLVAISLLPVIATYFAYGSYLEMIYMGISAGTLITFILMILKPTKIATILAFFFGILTFVVQFINMKFFWFKDEGGDPIVKVVFTLFWVLLGVAVVLLFKQMKILSKQNS